MKHVKRTLAGAMLLLVPLVGLADRPPANPETRRTHEEIKNTIGVMPEFMKVYPEAALPGAWQVMKGVLLNAGTAVDPKHKELIGLAVAAQIPCDYCTLYHERFARFHGASDAEIREAIALAASERMWSTVIAGSLPEEAAFRREADRMLDQMMKMKKEQAGAEREKGALLTDATAAERDIQARLGSIPTMFQRFPRAGLAGAWAAMKNLDMSMKSAIEPKHKDLIMLAVGSQIPNPNGVYFSRRSAEIHGATPQELDEAVAVGALTRHWSTILNGNRVDEKAFENDLEKMLKHARKTKATASR